LSSRQHTIFTVFIYVVLAIKSEANSTNVGMAFKVGVCFVGIIALYETPGVFKTIFRCALALTPCSRRHCTSCTALSLMPTVIGNTFAASLRTDISPQRKEARPRLTL
jgi:hypothetical protein